MRDVCSSGYSWVRLKRDGDMMAGHRKRRKSEPLMSRSAISSRPLSAQRTLQEAKISFNSRGKTLRKEQNSGSVAIFCKRCPLATTTHQLELTILQRASSQHMRRLAWWSGSTEGGILIGSTSQFSSDSYKALMKSPAKEIKSVNRTKMRHHNLLFSILISGLIHPLDSLFPFYFVFHI